MPLVPRTQADTLPPGSRILISGAPLTFKTTSSLTWPRPIVHVSLPGEKGWETVPLTEEGVIPYIWRTDEVASQSPHAVIKEVETGIFGAIATGLKSYGPRWTLVLEGLHKMYGWHYKARFLDLQGTQAYQKDPDDDKISGRAYGMAHDSYQHWLHRTLTLPVPFILGTIWEGKTKDDLGDTSKRAPTHIFPDLPGEMAKRIVGEFTITLYSEASQPDIKGLQRGKWTVKPQGKIWGVGVHLPTDIAKKIPAFIQPKDMRACSFTLDLEPLLQGEPTPPSIRLPSVETTPTPTEGVTQ